MGIDLSKVKDYGINIICLTDYDLEILGLMKLIFQIEDERNSGNLRHYTIQKLRNWVISIFPKFSQKESENDFERVKNLIIQNCQTGDPKKENNLLLCFTEGLHSSMSKDLLKSISSMYSHYHPQILIIPKITDKPIEEIEIKEENLDSNNIFVITNEPKEIKMAIYKSFLYYSQYPELESLNVIDIDGYLVKTLMMYNDYADENHKEEIIGKNFVYTLNFMCVGRPGVGKSAFINHFLGERRAKEASGTSVTNIYKPYSHSKHPFLTIYDTPGFETRDDVRDVIKKIRNVNNGDTLYNIHLVLFFINSSSRTILDGDDEFIRFCLKTNLPIIFILTRCEYKEKAKDTKEILSFDLNKIDANLSDNIVCLQLKDEPERNIKSFGFNEVIEKIKLILTPIIGKEAITNVNLNLNEIRDKGKSYANSIEKCLDTIFEPSTEEKIFGVFGTKNQEKKDVNIFEKKEFILRWFVKCIGCGYGINLSIDEVELIYQSWTTRDIGRDLSKVKSLKTISSLKCIAEKYCWDEVNRNGKNEFLNKKKSEYEAGLKALVSLIRQESN